MPFEKGRSGNPNGRPPKVVEDATQSVLLRLFDERAEIGVVKAQIDRARKGDTNAATWLWDRKYGKVTEKVDNRSAITIRIVDESAPDAQPDD